MHLLTIESKASGSSVARPVPVGVRFKHQDCEPDVQAREPVADEEAHPSLVPAAQPEDHGDYRGVAMTAAESKALRELEALLGIPIPASSERTLSFTAEAGHVVGLRCQGKHLVTLPESLGNLRWLKTLEFEEGVLHRLPESLGRLTELTRLVVRGTQLDALPKSVGDLGNLSFLDLSNNRLVDLPGFIGGLQALEELRLDINQLVELPPSIGNLSSLHLLNAVTNLLASLPENIGLLHRLEDLDLHANQ